MPADPRERTAAAREASIKARRAKRLAEAEVTIRNVETLVKTLPPLPADLKNRLSRMLAPESEPAE